MAAIDYKQLYYTTDEIKARFKPSLANYFDVFIRWQSSLDGIKNSDINFLAYEAVLPGTSYQTSEVFGDRQGITETFANKRIYPPVDISFYIDSDYSILRFFETWMAEMSPNLGSVGDSYQKFKYPGNGGYKKEVIITKFERDFRNSSQRLHKGGTLNIPQSCTYTLRNAYPTNIISVPVSYDQSALLRTTITFNYDVYSFSRKDGNHYKEINPPPQSSSSSTTKVIGETNREFVDRVAGLNLAGEGYNPF